MKRLAIAVGVGAACAIFWSAKAEAAIYAVCYSEEEWRCQGSYNAFHACGRHVRPQRLSRNQIAQKTCRTSAGSPNNRIVDKKAAVSGGYCGSGYYEVTCFDVSGKPTEETPGEWKNPPPKPAPIQRPGKGGPT